MENYIKNNNIENVYSSVIGFVNEDVRWWSAESVDARNRGKRRILTRFEPIGEERRGKRWQQGQRPRGDFSAIWSKRVSQHKTHSPLAFPCTSSLRRRSYAPAAAFSNPDPVPPPKRFQCLSPFPAVEAAVSLDMLSFRLPERLGHNIITLNLSANPSPICLNNVRTGTNISKRIIQNLIFVSLRKLVNAYAYIYPNNVWKEKKKCMER